ncbi:YIP1 family protein [Thiohalophilus thiocyanatoxydans]|uniref:Yip1-like protein n=1 Tax=Thiohalophilus thiocyanatoxydans TaxID=381308 RepID=A0A4R8IIJ5_9GAMM|nr:YIP1 family protein [Thiohalophilus thiocyanatoxydans]TDY00471.1 Yip1-like protein [Thiohalophilus thiocyanatoxydans]
MNSRLLVYARPLVSRFWEICLLRKGPEDTPYSPLLLVLLLVAGYLLDNLRTNLLLPEITAFQLAGILLVHTLFMVLVTVGLLSLFGYRARIIQTLTALSGTSIILSVLILPFNYISSLNPEKFTMVLLIIIAVQIWSLVILGHILSHALSVHRLTGVIIAIGYLILGLAALDYLLPATN